MSDHNKHQHQQADKQAADKQAAAAPDKTPAEKPAEKQAKQAEPRYSSDAEVSSGRYVSPSGKRPQEVPSKHNPRTPISK